MLENFTCTSGIKFVNVTKGINTDYMCIGTWRVAYYDFSIPSATFVLVSVLGLCLQVVANVPGVIIIGLLTDMAHKTSHTNFHYLNSPKEPTMLQFLHVTFRNTKIHALVNQSFSFQYVKVHVLCTNLLEGERIVEAREDFTRLCRRKMMLPSRSPHYMFVE